MLIVWGNKLRMWLFVFSCHDVQQIELEQVDIKLCFN